MPTLPPGPAERPAVQTLRWVFRPLAFMESARRRFGDAFSVRFTGFESPMVMLSDPEVLRALYTGRDHGLPPGRTFALRPLLGPRSVLLLEGREHLDRRRLMLPAFHGGCCTKPGCVRWGGDDSWMAQNFLACDREQELLLPPSVRDWLPEDHFAWFVLAAVEELDLAVFYSAYRADGHGRAAHDPGMMVALLLYTYARGQRSSRGIERGCIENVAYRVIAANQLPDHCTIARFRQRHQDALAGLFGEVLGLCAKAGLVDAEVLAVDGTKVHANASEHANRDYEQLAREILGEADEVDRLEDEQFGERRGDELPPELSTAQGRRGWLREAKRQLERERAQEARPVPASRPARAREAKRRLEDELFVEARANDAYEAYRARGRMSDGRRFGGPPSPYTPPATPAGKVNLTDPDSRNLKAPRGYLQGYNAQAVVTSGQVVIAAELNNDSPDFGHLEPMITTALVELAAAGVTEPPEVVLADAGYWHQQQMDAIVARGIQVLIPPDSGKRKGTRPGWDGGRYAFMRRVLSTDAGGALYAKRQGMIEPVFADTKFNRRIDRFQRRGRAACRSEWRLITATHNLLKLHRHQIAAAGA